MYNNYVIVKPLQGVAKTDRNILAAVLILRPTYEEKCPINMGRKSLIFCEKIKQNYIKTKKKNRLG